MPAPVVAAGPLELAELVVELPEPRVAHAQAVRPGPTVVSRDPAAPVVSTAVRPDQPVAGAAVPPAGWVVPHWLGPWRDRVGLEQQASIALVALEPLASTVQEGLGQRV